MPLTNCETHGDVSCLEMCNHLYSNLEKGIFSSFYNLPVYKIRMCKACFVKYKVEKIIDSIKIEKGSIELKKKQEKGIYQIAPDYHFEIKILEDKHPEILREIQHIYTELNKESGFECVKCIDKIQLDYARENDFELPFEPFENTIIHNGNKDINKLEKILEKQVKMKGVHLEQSTNSYEMQRSYQVWAGSVKFPLTIKIYGFTKEEEQNKLLDLIEDFFKNISKKQRKIIFYESLNWIHTELENGMKRKTRDKEKMISEITIK